MDRDSTATIVWRYNSAMKNPDAVKQIPRQVFLRPIEPADLDLFFEFRLDDVANHMAAFTHKDPTDRPAFDVHWERALAMESTLFRTIECDGQVVGSVGSYVVPELGEPEVTYWIGRDHWGKGVATLALQQFLDLQTVRPIFGRFAVDNTGSRRVLEKCGFTPHGTDRSYANARSEEIEEIAMIRRER